MSTPTLDPAICDLLYRLGVTANYVGYFQAAYAVQLAIEDPRRLLFVTKWIYPEVAKAYHTNWGAVERNIRSVSLFIWQRNRPLLEQLAGKPLSKKPPAGHLLAILAHSLEMTDSVQQTDQA